MPEADPTAPEAPDWIARFRRRHGRSPRALHLGNVANNAYNNAKLLNRAGLDCDVMCNDYYHIMGCPEWEDADIEGDIENQFYPDWDSVNLRGFRRPPWFAQGPVLECIWYLLARRRGRTSMAWFWGRELSRFRRKISRASGDSAGRSLLLRASRLARALWQGTARPRLAQLWPGRHRRTPPASSSWEQTECDLLREFSELFPDRPDTLVPGDLSVLKALLYEWRRLFACYDVVQAYATMVQWPLVVGATRYVGFEHGTLRDFTLGDSAACRLTAMGYRKADHVFITNGDCLDYARRIGVKHYSPMLHPVDNRRAASARGDPEGLRRSLGARYLFLCPLRHDWAVKGTDKYIRALPALAERLRDDFRLILVNWGEQVEDSKRLAAELSVADRVHWIEPMNRTQLLRMLKSVDVLCDQIALPHFGSTAPEGVAAGVPVVMSYDPRSTDWLVAEPAPLLSAWTAAEAAERIVQALDPAWLADYRRRAQRWIERCHNTDIVVRDHLRVYERLIEDRQDEGGTRHEPK